MMRKVVGALLAVGLVHLAAEVGAAEKSRFGSQFPSRPGSVGVRIPGEPPGDPVNLVLDDGTQENGLGLTAGGGFVWLNRFTPVEFPVGLTQIQILWIAPVAVGNQYDFFTYSDADGNPANGAVNVSSHTGLTVGAIGSFETTTFPSVGFAGPGDILVAAVNRTGMQDIGDFPARLDQTVSQVRSWVGLYSVGNPPTPPPIPADSLFSELGGIGFPGNWMLRASGTVTPVELQNLTVE